MQGAGGDVHMQTHSLEYEGAGCGGWSDTG